ncbi:dUTP pyrophosphatase [Staphylococcus saprophyticus]|uniref:dUTP diphosphatase n=1 Tax=Staphylococcus saprophyticus TaxID=29385 RepID=UPI000852AC6B|nr:dUTP pyrophosphatase [Staphylococcus saprophyticus]MDW4150182.1 dUTP pyrophosphatase [Staphylococcus saprophyticus]MDW4377868.1 dUTP pyrophosphatase [Staphylococcus saprophyticus]OEK13200.1 dUTP pyrophosphatase [Staphylococcus saprophyticus]OEK18812.1 dUTP pyrophosphatase [Staphylococcus saprophyticus]QKQ32222.1 dUTP pyrophosphatase [Staphylococcus saprophyticus]
MINTLEIKLLSDNATKPKRADDESAGYDIYAAETVILEPQEKALIATDLAVNIPKGYVGLLTSRSGVSSKTHLVVETGKIDAGFQGHMKINIKNDIDSDTVHAFELADIKGSSILDNRERDGYSIGGSYQINKGDRLAQLVIVPIWTPELETVGEFESETARGQNGFGSSGTR